MSQSQVFRIKTLCIVVLLASLLTPSFPTFYGLPALRIDDLLLIPAPLYLMLVVKRVIIDLRVMVLGLVTLTISFGIFWGGVSGHNAAMGDYFFVARIAKYIGALMLASALVDVVGSQVHAVRWFFKSFVVVGSGLGLIIIQQYFDIFELNATYVQFVAPTQYDTLVGNYPWPRPVGFVGNPNEVGFILGLLGLASAWLFLSEVEKNVRWGLLGVFYLGLMLLTLSRSATLSIIGGLVLMLIMFASMWADLTNQSGCFRKARHRALVVLFFAAFVAQANLLLTDIEDTILWRFSGDFTSDALTARTSNWSENLSLIEDSPIFGVGTLQRSGEFNHAADNEWLLLARIGGVGLPLLVASLFIIGFFQKTTFSWEFGPFVLALTAASFIYMIPAVLFFNGVIMPLVLLILALTAPRNFMSIWVGNKSISKGG
jgi:hypothetical protein